MAGLRLLTGVGLALALALGSAGAANAQFSSSSSQSDVDPSGGSTIEDVGTNSSSATLDANNYARSFITPGTTTMGAIVATDGTARPFTTTTRQNSWWFQCGGPNICGSVPLTQPIPLHLKFGINVSETQVTNNAYLEFDANYQLQTGGEFSFTFAQDGKGDFELNSNYVSSTGVSTEVPVVQTLANGIWSLSVDATVPDQICGSAYVCVPEEMSCDGGQNCSNPPVFTDIESIKALIDESQGETDVIDGYDPFTVQLVSDDPNYQFVSTDGLAPVAGSVPEPATWAMMLLGAFGVGASLRSRRRPRPQLAAEPERA